MVVTLCLKLYVAPKLGTLVYVSLECTWSLLLRIRDGVICGVRALLALSPREHARTRPVARASRAMKERVFVACSNMYLTLRARVCLARERTRQLLLRGRDKVVRGVGVLLTLAPLEQARLLARSAA